MSAEHLYIIAYDIRCPKRWRRLFKLMEGSGAWLQYSIFQCRLSRRRLAEVRTAVEEIVHHTEDHVVFLDLGPADQVDLRVTSIGKTFEAVQRRAIIV